MTNWYLEKHDLSLTPSILDGIDLIKESEYRKEGARFIMQLGTQLGLGYATIATGIVYFHKFYLSHSFKKFSKHLTACCCLFLSGKAEETPKRAKDVIRTAKAMLKGLDIEKLSENPMAEMMILEKILLKAIKFDFKVEHPYRYLLKYAKCLKGKKEDLEKLVQVAWTFVNDSFCTTLCLQFQAKIIAIACLYLASKIIKFEIVDWENRKANQSYWWEVYAEGITIKFIEEICHELLDVYSSENSKNGERETGTTETNISCNDSENCKTDYLGTETLSFCNKLNTKYLNETRDSRSNFDVKLKQRNILFECNNVLDKSTVAATTTLNEDVWNTLKKIQMSDITNYQKPANTVIQQNILSIPNYEMPVPNFPDYIQNGPSYNPVNVPHEKTNFPLSSNYSMGNENLCKLPITSAQIHDFKQSQLYIPQTPSEQHHNIFLSHSQSQNSGKNFNKLNPNGHMSALQENLYFESTNHRVHGYYNSGPNSLLQGSLDSSQDFYAQTMLSSSSQQPFYLEQSPLNQ